MLFYRCGMLTLYLVFAIFRNYHATRLAATWIFVTLVIIICGLVSKSAPLHKITLLFLLLFIITIFILVYLLHVL
jgi:hypothetical protein